MSIQWPLLLFSLIAGCGGATFAFVGISELLGVAKESRLKITVISIALMIVGGICSVAHLGQPANIMAAAQNIFSFSGISVEIIVLGLSVIVALIYVIVIRGGNFGGASKGLGALGIVLGLLLGFVTGNGYVMDAQPLWDTVTLPLAYLGTDIALGGFLYVALAQAFKSSESDCSRFMPIVIACSIICAATCLLYGAVVGFALNPAVFWVGVIIMAVLSVIFAFLAKSKKAVAYAGLLTSLVCGVCLRIVMWLSGTGFLDMFSAAEGHTILGI